MVSCLVLDENLRAEREWGERLGVFSEGLPGTEVALGHGTLPEVKQLGPSAVGIVLSGENGQAVPQLSTKDCNCRRESIVFLYDRMALWKLSLSNDPDMLQFDMILFSCLTANSTRQLLCEFATEDNLW